MENNDKNISESKNSAAQNNRAPKIKEDNDGPERQNINGEEETLGRNVNVLNKPGKEIEKELNQLREPGDADEQRG